MYSFLLTLLPITYSFPMGLMCIFSTLYGSEAGLAFFRGTGDAHLASTPQNRSAPACGYPGARGPQGKSQPVRRVAGRVHSSRLV